MWINCHLLPYQVVHAQNLTLLSWAGYYANCDWSGDWIVEMRKNYGQGASLKGSIQYLCSKFIEVGLHRGAFPT